MTDPLQPKGFKKPRAWSPRKAFQGSQLEVLKLAPFYVTVFQGKLMGGFPLGVKMQVVTALLHKGTLETELVGLKLHYRLTEFGKEVLTRLEAYDNVEAPQKQEPTK